MTTSEESVAVSPRPPAVKINKIRLEDVTSALAQGWRDFTRAPFIGLFFGAIYAAGGIAIWLLLSV